MNGDASPCAYSPCSMEDRHLDLISEWGLHLVCQRPWVRVDHLTYRFRRPLHCQCTDHIAPHRKHIIILTNRTPHGVLVSIGLCSCKFSSESDLEFVFERIDSTQTRTPASMWGILYVRVGGIHARVWKACIYQIGMPFKFKLVKHFDAQHI